MKEQMMNIEFIVDHDEIENTVVIEFAGKKIENKKDEVLLSLDLDIAKKGFIVNNEISRQDIGEFIYYGFIYYDGTNSRNVQIRIPKGDMLSIRKVDMIKFRLDDQRLEEDTMQPEIIFEDEEIVVEK